MKKIIIAVLAAASLFTILSCKKADSKKFVLGLDASFPPMGFTEADGSIVGYDIDLAKEVSSRLGLEFVAKPIDWDSKEMELSSGSIDCIWNGFTITPERQKAMSFTPAYLNNAQVLVVRKASNIKTLADAKGISVACQAGSSAEEAIKDNAEFASSLKNLVYYEENITALTDVKVGSVDGVVMDKVVANYMLALSGDDLEIVDETLASEEYGIGFNGNKEGAELRDKVWATLVEMAKDGTVAKISEKWFGSDISVIEK